MIPLRDENPTELRPWMTVLLILANLAAWLTLQGAGEMRMLEASVVVFGTYPCELTGACPTEGLGWEALFSSMFMHGGWGHLLGNLWFLWVFGNNIEDSMGHLRFLVFYLVCGVAAGLAHVYLSPQSAIPAVGASGAISGIMGAYVILYPRAKVQAFFPPFFFFWVNAIVFLVYWFVMQLFTGVAMLGLPDDQGGVAVWAHVGGFVAGVALIRLFDRPRLVEAKRHKVHLSAEEVAPLRW